MFTCPKGISRGRLGSWLSALTLPLAWPGSKGFTAFFGLIVGVSVESGNVCRLSKVSVCLWPPGSSPPHTAPHAGPGVPATRTPGSHLPLPFTPFPLHTCPCSPPPRRTHLPRTDAVHGLASTAGHPSPPPLPAHLRASAHTRVSPSRVPGFLAFPKSLLAHVHLSAPQHTHMHMPPTFPASSPTHTPSDRQTDRHPASQTTPRPRRPPSPRTAPEPGPGAGAEEGGRAPPASPPRFPALWTFVWLCG